MKTSEEKLKEEISYGIKNFVNNDNLAIFLESVAKCYHLEKLIEELKTK